MATYKIIRSYHPALNKEDEVISTGLTKVEARAHCKDPNTRVEGEYFGGIASPCESVLCPACRHAGNSWKL